jgi:hypothetical protein
VISAIALAPPVLAGVLIFGLPAVEVLGVAIGAGALVHGGCRLLNVRSGGSPVVAAVIGVAFAGTGAPLVWAAAIAVAAALLEAARSRFAPECRIQAGVVAFCAVYLASRGAPASYVEPGWHGSPAAALEPIRQWLTSHDTSAVIGMKLYLGSIAGPVFATSLLAVFVSAAFLWYVHRLNVPTVVAFGVGALAVSVYLRWTPTFELTSGPLWFMAALVLADRGTTPAVSIVGTVLGLAAGAATIAARRFGFAIEAAPFVALAAQALWTGLEVALQAVRGSRRKARQQAARERLESDSDQADVLATLPPVPLALARRQHDRTRSATPEVAAHPTKAVAPALATAPRQSWPESKAAS